MANETQEKQTKASKSFMTVGPTLHYSHANVHGCYFLALGVYFLTAMFWSKLMAGDTLSIGTGGLWHLDKFILSPLSIFEYPIHIFIIGLLIGIFIVVPVLAAQLMSFRYSILFLLILGLFAKLGGLAIFTAISCIAVASRPLRFRSRYIALVSSFAPVFLYLGFSSGTGHIESIRWALSLSPWLDGAVSAALIGAVVLGIGHFTRYRPGLIWSTAAIALLGAIILFQSKINLAELDYQLYVAKNNPETVTQFQGNSITESLDRTLKKRQSHQYFQPPFYPNETIPLRATLKREIVNRLAYDRWPEWMDISKELRYQKTRQILLDKYEMFISPEKQWFKPKFLHNAMLKSKVRIKRMPIALYYKALLSEFTPNVNLLEKKEILYFYSDYPHKENLPIWHRLYFEYPDSVESIEARWRRAMHLAGIEKFSIADSMIQEALKMISQVTDKATSEQSDSETLFVKPAKTVITNFEIKKIRRKLLYLREIMSQENLGKTETNHMLLAKFILLNKHDRYYSERLADLLERCEKDSPIRDNILLAQTMQIPDAILRAEKLGQLSEEYKKTDGGIRAKFEQASLKVSITKEHNISEQEKEKFLTEAKAELEQFITDHANCIFAEEAAEKLSSLGVR
ncbi:MAG: hypothetical protein K8R02_06120 [Anaerohalosphaeraceae bacterium]|nr:hypothetical protein [Anaerohalosphaeraceae bacterium]